MRILVTGAYGFIGSKIVEKLCAMGHDVTAMDNSETYGVIAPEELKKLYSYRQRNWGQVSRNPGDVSESLDVLKAFRPRPDYVIPQGEACERRSYDRCAERDRWHSEHIVAC